MGGPADALIISTYFPRNATFAGGVHRRLDMLVESLGRASSHVTALFLVRHEIDCSEPERRQYEEYLRARWRLPLSLRLAAVRQPPQQLGGKRWRQLLGGAFNVNLTARISDLYNRDADAAVAEALADGPGLILAHRMDAMCALLRAPGSAGDAKVFFDLDDVEHVATFRRLLTNPAWPAERLQLLHLPALIAGERRAVRRAQATFVCSNKDKRHLETLFRTRSVRVVPNSTTVSDTALPATPGRTVLFVGTFEYPPNVQAADSLVRSVWPLVRASVPDARLVIVGKQPELVPAYATAPRDGSVVFTGFVDDIRATYAEASVVCCPIRVGAGTRVKIVEAAGFARPVVSTPLGAEGLEFRDGVEILLRESDRDLAAACTELLLHPDQARTIGLAAWERARAVYDRASVVRLLESVFRNGTS